LCSLRDSGRTASWHTDWPVISAAVL
jgi:hypothetical protein